jgi:hypothetical protein
MSRPAANLPRLQSDFFVPQGGLDEITPPLQLSDGAARAMQNFEQGIRGGYRRIDGFERWGNNVPSERLQYQVLTVFTPTIESLGGNYRIQGATSGARALVIGMTSLMDPDSMNPVDFAVPAGLNSGIIIAEVQGAFTTGETIQRASPLAAPTGTAMTAVSQEPFASGDALSYASTINNADRFMRASVVGANYAGTLASWKVVGLGAINNTVYRFVVYRSRTDSGAPGPTTLVIETPSTTDPSAFETQQGWGWSAAAPTVPLDGSSTIFPIAPEYIDLVEYNFSGATAAKKLYGVSGIGRGFSFDGTTLVGITTGMTGTLGDKPTRVAIHKNRLFYGFGASLQFSAAGDPTSWTPVLGAGEISMGETITAMGTAVGNDQSSALLVGTDRGLAVLYGDTSSTFNLVWVSREMGVRAGSLQMMTTPLFVNDYGVTSLAASQSFGNFDMATVSQAVQRFMKTRVRNVTCSVLARSKNQYRVFFDDGTGLYFTFSGAKLAAITPVRFPKVVRRTWVTRDYAGQELIVFASDDLFVYRMDTGNTFDGVAIDAYLFMSFNHMKSPRMRKAFRRAALEVEAEGGYVAFQAGGNVDHGGPDAMQSPETSVDSQEGTLWDELTWDQFVWDTGGRQPSVVPLDGTGKNLSIWLRCNSALVDSFTLTGVMTEYFQRRTER